MNTENSLSLLDAQLKEVFTHFSGIVHVILFGSVAFGCQRVDNNFDLAVAASADG